MKRILLSTAVLLLAVSCHRKPLYDECICSNTLPIPIDVDWETSGVEPQNVTVLFYDAEDGSLLLEHKYEQNDNDIQSYVYLSEGKYTAVVFNELRDQIDYVSCVGYDNISTLKFESNDDDPLRSRATTRSYVGQPGDLAVKVVDSFEVTTDMIVEMSYYYTGNGTALSTTTQSTVDAMLGIVPLKKNATVVITAHVKNIYYARMPALVDLVNLADGYFAFSDNNSTVTSTIQFTMNNRTYDTGSTYDGTISATLSAFGSLDDRYSVSGHDGTTPVTLDMLFQLIDDDSTETSLAMDVTNSIAFYPQSDGSVLMTIDVDFEDALPEVVAEDSGEDSGFSSVLIDWGVVDVPLTFE